MAKMYFQVVSKSAAQNNNNNLINNYNINNNYTSAKDEQIKSEMMKKLSLREQWLHSSPPQPPAVPVQKPTVSQTDEQRPKRSFFEGILESLSTFIKPEKHVEGSKMNEELVKNPEVVPKSSEVAEKIVPKIIEQPKAAAPQPKVTAVPQKSAAVAPKVTMSPKPVKPAVKTVEDFDEIFKDSIESVDAELDSLLNDDNSRKDDPKTDPISISEPKSEPKKKLKVKKKTNDDDVLEKIKKETEKIDKKQKKIDAKKFKSSMESIKSQVLGQKVSKQTSERDFSKFFGVSAQPTTTATSTPTPKKEVPKRPQNKDVAAIQDDIAKYFPSNPSSAKGSTGNSSSESSPVLGRKKASDVDLTKYFPQSSANSVKSTPAISRKSSTPSISQKESAKTSPVSSRKNSITSPIPANKPLNLSKVSEKLSTSVPMIQKVNLVTPAPKKNALAMQTVSAKRPEGLPKKNALAQQTVAAKSKKIDNIKDDDLDFSKISLDGADDFISMKIDKKRKSPPKRKSEDLSATLITMLTFNSERGRELNCGREYESYSFSTNLCFLSLIS